MPTGFTISKINYANTATGNQTFRIEYKLFSASAWTLVSANASANSSGVLAVPLPVTGLTSGQLYYIRAANNCDSPPDWWVQQVQL